MTLVLDFPTSRQSLVGRIDPRWKLAALLPATILAALLRTLPVSLSALGGAMFLVVLGRLPMRWYVKRMVAVGLFLGLLVIWLPFLSDEGPTWDLGWTTLSVAGAERAAALLSKGLALVSLMLVLLATAPLPDTFKAAHAVGIPGLVVQLVLLTYRHVFLIGEEFGRLRTALRVRGFRNRANLHSYRTIGRVAGTLLVRSHERAERVGQAMRSRGFDGRFRTLNEFRTTWRDVAFWFLVIACAVFLLGWDYGWWPLTA